MPVTTIVYKNLRLVEDPIFPGTPKDNLTGAGGDLIQDNFRYIADNFLQSGEDFTFVGDRHIYVSDGINPSASFMRLNSIQDPDTFNYFADVIIGDNSLFQIRLDQSGNDPWVLLSKDIELSSKTALFDGRSLSTGTIVTVLGSVDEGSMIQEWKDNSSITVASIDAAGNYITHGSLYTGGTLSTQTIEFSATPLNSVTWDVNLYRLSAHVLKTDDTFIAGTKLLINTNAANDVIASGLTAKFKVLDGTLRSSFTSNNSASGWWAISNDSMNGYIAKVTDTNELIYGTATNQNVSIYTNNTARLTVKSNGLVGLGVTPASISSQLTLPGGTTSTSGILFGNDTKLYRSGVGQLTTDSGFIAGSGTFLGNVYTSGLIVKGPNSINVNNGNAIDENFSNGGIFRTIEVNVAGTNDIFFQALPASTAGFGILEAWTAAGLVIGTGNNDSPVIIKTNRIERARITPSGLCLGGTTTPSGIISLGSSTSPTGGIYFGGDTNLYRSTTNTLKTDSNFVTSNRISFTTPQTSGLLNFGAGTTASSGIYFGSDTNLYRSAFNNLKTDSNFTSAATISGARLLSTVATLTPISGAITPLTDTANVFKVSTGTVSVSDPSGTFVDGQLLILRIKNTTASSSISFGSTYRGSADLSLPTGLTATSGKTDYLTFRYNLTDTKWDYVAKNFGF